MDCKRWIKKWIVGEISGRRILISLVEIYTCLLIFGWCFSDRLIFQPQPSSYEYGGPFSRIPVTPTEQIGLLSLPNPNAQWTILHCHGNAEDIGELYEFIGYYRSHGFQVFAFDYRGYGISDGTPGTVNACADGEAALLYLVQVKKIPLNRIILHGRSIGSGIASHLAAKYRVAGLILESPFLTAFRVRTVIPIAPFDKLRNNRRIREIKCPLLVIHGLKDEIIPAWHGQQLFEMATVPKQAYWIPNAHHNDVAWVAGQEYWNRIVSFTKMVN